MKKILLNFTLFASLASANTINAVAVVVDKEAITNYDIEQRMKILNIPKNQALGMLINEKMESSQIKKFGIFVNDLEVDEAVKKIVAQNNTNLENFKAMLKAKNQNYEQFRLDLKKDLEKRKLYEAIVNTAKIDYSDAGALNFFEQNKEKFTLFTSIEANIYSSNNEENLENLRQNKKTMLKPSKAFLNTNNSDPRLLALLSQVELNDFSPVLNGKNGYEIYEIKAKNGAQIPNFEQVKNEILNAYVSEQRQNYIQDYFDKLRTSINIEYLR